MDDSARRCSPPTPDFDLPATITPATAAGTEAHEPLAAVAKSLQVNPAPEAAPLPSDVNRDLRAKLSADDLKTYYLTLYGESAEAMTAMEQSGGASDHEDFATHGCVGQATQEIGSIWTLRRGLQPQLDELGRQVRAAIADRYQACTVAAGGEEADYPGAIEDALDGLDPYSEEATKLRATYEQCAPVWAEASREANADLEGKFVAANEGVLAEQAKRYDGVNDSIDQDQPFRTYLANALTHIKPEEKPAG